MTTTMLTTSTRDSVTVIELFRPETKNSLNRELLDALVAQHEVLRHDDAVGAVVLTGSKAVFCAGADVTACDSLCTQPLLGDRAALGVDFWTGLGVHPEADHCRCRGRRALQRMRFESTLSQGLEHEKRNFDVAIRSADSEEGQAAFLSSEPPISQESRYDHE